MRWILWLLTGFALALVILLAASLLGLARINPWLARRLARSAVAAGLLRIFCEVGMILVSTKGDRVR